MRLIEGSRGHSYGHSIATFVMPSAGKRNDDNGKYVNAQMPTLRIYEGRINAY